MGGKTGLYEVGIPIKENTKKGYKMAYPGDSIDLGYANLNTRRGRVGHEIAHTLTTESQQGTVHFVDMSAPPFVTENARCLNTKQDSSIHKHKGESSGVLVETGPRAILTPERLKKRQNGRRMKEPEEPMLPLTPTWSCRCTSSFPCPGMGLCTMEGSAGWFQGNVCGCRDIMTARSI